MNYSFTPFLRYVSKTSNLIEDKELVCRDARLLYVLSGTALFRSLGTEFPLKSGALVYYPYGKEYGFYENRGLTFYTLNFDFTCQYADIPIMRPRSATDPDIADVLHTADATDTDLFLSPICIDGAFFAQKDIEAIYEEEIKRDAGYREVQSLLLKRLLISISRVCASGGGNPITDRIKEYVRSAPGIKINEIASLMSYHPYYLNEIFKGQEGVSLHRYLSSYRLGLAHSLLVNTDLTVAQIAEKCGFSSPSHLSASFKAEYGISPSQIRK